MPDPRARRTLLAALLALGSAAPLLAAVAPAGAATAPGASTAATLSGVSTTHGRSETRPRPTHGQAVAALDRVRSALRPKAPGTAARTARGSATELTTAMVQLWHARPVLTGSDRQQADRLLARPTDSNGGDIAKYDPSLPVRQWCRPGSTFCIHWVTSGRDAISTTDANHDGVPDYVATVAATMDHVYATEVGRLGYRAPLPDTDTVGTEPGNPDGRTDIYLAQLGDADVYGYCAPEGYQDQRQLPGYCVLDNDYREYGTAPALALEVTAAHEFFHAVQFGYDVDEDTWFMEGTATWMESQVYPAIHDNFQYLGYSPLLRSGQPVDYSADLFPYGSWLFFRYASEFLHDPGVVRAFWEAAAADRSAYSLQAIQSTVARRHSWSDFFLRFGLWNLLAPGSYADRAAYSAKFTPAYRASRTLTPRSPSTGVVRSDLHHLSSVAVRVVPGPTLPVRARLRVTVDAPSTSRGSAALLLVRRSDGSAQVLPLALDRNGNGGVVLGFDRRRVRSVSVVTADTSAQMTGCGTVSGSGGGPLFSCWGRGTTDPTSADPNSYRVTARIA